ncbi:RlpA-like double-psi beta-barrel-protein domain-containing protein-containing protein [Aspergillus coremiiformis]|uniref:RlpA-like double-psi beta-barrel-protein domain-containing protein-containing protein n=1 Tax=Aspergillus coremiiformis TaxID=138285 RepID=A0A5N6Z4B1_9EURO|nr:RlpA-like double-psi beta-barrel-protein domain-containing protein-containing protein [Aspergillus coremiiformis]
MPESEPQSHPPTGVPKRKPVPIPGPGPNPTPNPNPNPNPNPTPPENPPQHKESQWTKWTQLPQKKRLIIISTVIAILLIALIIGLAVGLTRPANQNLPLPTSHGGPYTGDLTYYDPGMGSCGISSSNSDLVCAVSHVLFDAASKGSNPNANPLCGLKIRLKREESSVDVKVVDRCVGCAVKDLDVSPAVFKKLADMDLGRVRVDWAWLEDSPVAA